MTSRLILDRRKFLLGAGATALTLPFLRALPSYAASGTDKRYLILAFAPCGVVRHRWGVTSTGPNPGDFTFKDFLMPLTPIKNNVIIVDGLDNKAAGNGIPTQGTHEGGMATLWNGTNAPNGTQSGAGQTIDQAIAQQLNAGTTYPSLEFYVQADQDYTDKGVDKRMIYSAANAPIDPRADPNAALTSLFGNISSTTTGPDPALVRQQSMRAKMFAHLDAQLAATAPKLCNEDKVHLDALRAAWADLNATYSAPPPPTTATCTKPVTNAAGLSGFQLKSRQMLDLLAMSMACDLTRVASIQYSQAVSPMIFDWMGMKDSHHTISHNTPSFFNAPNSPSNPAASDLSNTTYKTAWDQLVQIGQYHMAEVAYLAQKLAAIPVGGGKTLLDQTVICWGTEINNGGWHDHNPLPFVLIGGGAGKLKTGGLFQDYGGEAAFTANQNDQNQTAARSHNDLLVTLAQIMGTNITTFGTSAYNKSQLSELYLS
ncbi:MAG TPA: DUF1552 domain-containing protein [Polyangiaceae bacterium]|jgi:hypothetical protein